LRITISAATPEAATSAARAVAERLEDSASVGKVCWQPLWKSDSAGVEDWIAWQWMNGDPEALRRLSERLGADQVTGTLAEALETLRFSLAPDEIARLAYDPLGLIRVGSAE